ncbi:hypothetical protein [Mucilaginibacter aquatilis]|uniref:Uncharacterized protein n=1 Tax=Mucilaginibacter aquatilis TaxID=1517760 RepID=A0A6I4IC18_9SPHI|nr:hypothetical protein [Mucilaginibacter aquatilis]MVN92761.1 hypothetical protein [Mucilaginibacter aquatilis]
MINRYLPSISKTYIFKAIMVLCAVFVSLQVKAQTAASDIDRLYQKYKGNTETTIFVGDKEVNARVLINYNAHNKPYRIIIYGEALADSDMDELIDQLCDAKIKAGYRRSPSKNVVNFDQNGIYENNIDVSTFQKGTQYAKYGIKKMEARNQLVGENGTPKYSSDFFYFEVGDNARKRTSKPEKFDF